MMRRFGSGVTLLSALVAVEVGACTFGPQGDGSADASAPAAGGAFAATGGTEAVATGGSRSTGGALTGGAGGALVTGGAPSGGTGGAPSTGGAGGARDASVPDGAPDAAEAGGVCGSCAAGQYCDPVDRTCKPGCGSGAACASGSCGATHDCDRCVRDTECAAGHVCSTGRCLPSCTTSQDCPSGFSCCGTRCADLSRDHAHCAACGTACSADDYCGATGCAVNTIPSVCDTPHMTFLKDGAPVDDALTPDVEAALLAACTPAPITETDPETASPATNPSTGEPVSGGGDLIVELGSPFSQRVARYIEGAGLTRVKDISDGTTFRLDGPSPDGGSDAIIMQEPASSFTATHDFFKIEMVVDPVSGTRILQIYGIFAPGTAAGEWFFLNRILPNLSAFPLRYYVYEWTHGDAGPNPGASDAFVLRASGN